MRTSAGASDEGRIFEGPKAVMLYLRTIVVNSPLPEVELLSICGCSYYSRINKAPVMILSSKTALTSSHYKVNLTLNCELVRQQVRGQLGQVIWMCYWKLKYAPSDRNRALVAGIFSAVFTRSPSQPLPESNTTYLPRHCTVQLAPLGRQRTDSPIDHQHHCCACEVPCKSSCKQGLGDISAGYAGPCWRLIGDLGP